MAKAVGLSGIGNVLPHQYIISDLIFGIRSKFVKDKKAKQYNVLSEISLSSIGNIYNPKKFTKNHNIDFVIIDAKTKDIVFIIEVERTDRTRRKTIKKMIECVQNISTIQEAFIISFDPNQNTTFEKVTLEKKLVNILSSTSASKFLGYNLKSSFVSLK